ncbi:MAG: ATP synthase F1 subunit delta [FCB group bacterium]|nr:ATP synthase F1 subunit delta [FCB group bacterium]
MLAQQVAIKYSTALFNLVREKNMVDLAFEQFEELDELVRKDDTLLQFLLAPHILDQQKTALLKDVFGGRLDPLFLEFLLVLVNKHRIGYLHEIIEEFRALVAEARGIVVARVTTAVPMTDDARSHLCQRLQTKTSKTVELDEKLDPAIMGGMIVILGDQIIDGSVRNKLSLLKDDLMKLKVA